MRVEEAVKSRCVRLYRGTLLFGVRLSYYLIVYKCKNKVNIFVILIGCVGCCCRFLCYLLYVHFNLLNEALWVG